MTIYGGIQHSSFPRIKTQQTLVVQLKVAFEFVCVLQFMAAGVAGYHGDLVLKVVVLVPSLDIEPAITLHLLLLETIALAMALTFKLVSNEVVQVIWQYNKR